MKRALSWLTGLNVIWPLVFLVLWERSRELMGPFDEQRRGLVALDEILVLAAPFVFLLTVVVALVLCWRLRAWWRLALHSVLLLVAALFAMVVLLECWIPLAPVPYVF